MATQRVLPQPAQTMFRHVVNSALRRYGDTATAFRVGWAALEVAGWRQHPSTGRWRQVLKSFTSWSHAFQPCAKQPTVSQVHVNSPDREVEKEHDGLWLGFVLSDEECAQLDGLGDPVPLAAAHATVAYVPDAGVAVLSEDAIDTACTALAATLPPFPGVLSGLGRFAASPTSDGYDVLVALVDSPRLEQVRHAVVEMLHGLNLDASAVHGYQPHVSLAYLAPDDPRDLVALPQSIPLAFRELTLRHGAYEATYPLTGSAPVTGHVVKVDAERQYVFGWASVALSEDGLLLEDRQGDVIDPADLEEMAYQFVLHFREADEMHEGGAIGVLIESCVFTADKLAQMQFVPVNRAWTAIAHWWVGFYIADPTIFARVKDGTYRMFSIGGEAVREDVAA